MLFYHRVKPDRDEVLRCLGYGKTTPDVRMLRELDRAVQTVEQHSTPRWNYARFRLTDGLKLEPVDIALPGRDIARHLQGCHACYLLSLTLGVGIEQTIRAAEASDMPQAVLLDTCASVLVEGYAAQAQEALQEEAASAGSFVTGRFSPGYGDFPLSLQPVFLRLTDAPRRIGLTTNESFILIPRKSVTAIVGIADHAVAGNLAGCEHCPLQEKCGFLQDGRGALCGKNQ